MRKAIFTALYLLVFVVGCATGPQKKWYHSSKTQGDFNQDKYACQQDAALYTGSKRGRESYDLDSNEIVMGGLFGYGPVLENKRFNQCMESKGYELRFEESPLRDAAKKNGTVQLPDAPQKSSPAKEDTSTKTSSDETKADETSIIKLAGSGLKDTRPFKVGGPWELQWDANGSYFGAYIYNADGFWVGAAANQQGAGKGSSYQPKGGHYYLKINAIGSWHVKVIEVRTSTKTSSDETKADETSIIKLTGSGLKDTRPFKVGGPWELQWDANGSYFGAYIYNADGSWVGVAANQQGAGKGSSYQPKGGHYYLKINAIGSWHVKVIEVR